MEKRKHGEKERTNKRENRKQLQKKKNENKNGSFEMVNKVLKFVVRESKQD